MYPRLQPTGHHPYIRCLVRILLVFLAAVALSAGTYLGLERLGRRAWPAMVARAIAWGALGLLLLNVSCPRPPVALKPLVLLDGSLSMTAAGRSWWPHGTWPIRWARCAPSAIRAAARDTPARAWSVQPGSRARRRCGDGPAGDRHYRW